MDKPTLADDEATLASYADTLIEAVDAVAESWIVRLIERRGGRLAATPAATEAAARARDAIGDDLRLTLALDIADQKIGPLEVLRRSVRFPTAVLADAGIGDVPRDDFSVRAFPEDRYDLTPASFGDIDPTLHEPGLMWGAAKAHVHLRRRREAQEREAEEEVTMNAANETVDVVVLSADLMDRSKISAAFPDATVVRSPAKLVQAAVGANLVLVDLGRLTDMAALLALPDNARVIAFGSHVDDASLAAAEAAGAEAMPRSVFFRRLESRDL